MTYEEKQPTDFLNRKFHKKYASWVERTGEKLLSLNLAILYLDKITFFPFDALKIPSPDRHFWRGQLNYLSEYIVIAIERLITDKDNRNFNLTEFKEAVFRAMVDANDKVELEKRLDEAGFGTLEQLNRRVKDIRHKYVAHLDKKRHLTPIPIQKFAISEFKAIFAVGAAIYNELCLNKQTALVVFDYLGYQRGSFALDIDHLLDATAQRSYLVSFTPERLRELKDHGASKLLSEISENDLRTINQYRYRAENEAITREDLEE